MCGRFDFHASPDRVAQRYFGLERAGIDNPGPHYNVPPGVSITVIHGQAREPVAFSRLHWGYQPFGAGDGAPTPINARAEKVAQSPFFREAFAHRRCLVPVNGWFEWQKTGSGKQPFYITCPEHSGDEVLFLAAIMDDRPAPGIAILTEPAAGHLEGIHPRQPVVLGTECLPRWLDRAVTERQAIRRVAERFDSARLDCWPVSSAVNRPGNDGAELIQRLR
ncbi:MAG: SOS response-associated peptidase [Oleiphilaceae bacterium]|nr:SOS response-associated peptidase [Oleiphilaceae bacterium]